MNELSKRSGISRQSLTNTAKRLGLKTRNVQSANKLTKNKGKNHYAFGTNKDNSAIAMAHSERMKKNNPVYNKFSSRKRAETISKTFKENLQPQEKIFRDILIKLGIEFEMQTPVGPYNLDFYIPALNQAIEIDSTDRWGIEKRDHARKRDDYMLLNHGIKTLRINKKFLTNEIHIVNLLKINNIIE